jgi:hypothetical protein
VLAATLPHDPNGLAGRLVGDLLVQPASATGRHSGGRHIPFPVDNGRYLGGLHHFHLLNHPDVYEAVRTWLRRSSIPANEPPEVNDVERLVVAGEEIAGDRRPRPSRGCRS